MATLSRGRGAKPGGPASWMPRDERGRLQSWDSDRTLGDGTIVRTCIWCKQELPLETGFSHHPYARANKQTICKTCVRVRKRELFRRLREAAIEALGGAKCAKCGFSDPRAIEVDHIECLITARASRPCREVLYREIIAGRTDNLQLLCANCHTIKTWQEMKAHVDSRYV